MAEALQGLSALQKRIAAISGPKPRQQMMTLIGLQTVAYAKRDVARKTGNLGRSIHVQSATDDEVVVLASAGYAAYVELGTRPHDITPKVARVLAWGGPRRLSGALRSGGKPTHFAMKVHHPGTKPKPYLIPAAKRALEETGADFIVSAWNKAG